MPDIAISVDRIGKRYRIGQHPKYRTLRDSVTKTLAAPFRMRRASAANHVWALKDVSFEVQRGEVVGVIGANGSGKSTLLKILSRITEPTEGRGEIRGRVGSLLEVGTGFHRELTGRENTYLNGAILGMTRREIRRKFDEIVAFAEVERFIDTPVKHYSSGMYMRLAFAVAAHLEPEILLVDEVLAVGDAAFQNKCLGKMRDVAQAGRTVLFVSHNMAAVASLCTRCVVLRQGRVAASGSPQDMVEVYLSLNRQSAQTSLAERTDRSGNGQLRFTRVEVLNDRGEPVPSVVSGQDVLIALDYQIPDGQPREGVVLELRFSGAFGQPLFVCPSQVTQHGFLTLPPSGRLVCRIPRLPLVPGAYPFEIWCRVRGVVADVVPNAGELSVVEGDYFGTGQLPARQRGELLVTHSWSVENGRSAHAR